MARITINDLNDDYILNKKEMKMIQGGSGMISMDFADKLSSATQLVQTLSNISSSTNENNMSIIGNLK